MIITATDFDYECFRKQLLKLIKENASEISEASESAINAGLRTIKEPLPINRALIQRAIETIRDQMSEEYYERRAYECEAQSAMVANDAFNAIDSISPELLEERSLIP